MTDITSDTTISRRRALQAGVGAGVGLVAWSGATITSMGGTPAYAAGCTFVVSFFLENDRNTDQSDECTPGEEYGDFGWHHFNLNNVDENPKGPLPVGFSVTQLEPANAQVCNNVEHCATMTFSNTLTCAITVRVHDPQKFPSPGPWYFDETTIGVSPLQFCLPTFEEIQDWDPTPPVTKPVDFGSQARYSIEVRCLTTGADPSCFNPS
ncbi:MAG: hypothetical protein ACRDYW_07180 [Acidimicrobiales bacterium]